MGGILPDLAPASQLTDLRSEFQRGIRCHRLVDAYTDSHPIFRRSVQRCEPPFRRFGGILVDVFYDHFLTCNWQAYSTTPRPEFVSEFYATFARHRADLPPEAFGVLERMQAGDWLNSYGDIEGVTVTLRRISARLKRPVDLASSVSILERHYDSLHGDFADFFPELVAYVARVRGLEQCARHDRSAQLHNQRL